MEKVVGQIGSSILKLVEVNKNRTYYLLVPKQPTTKHTATVIFSHGLGDSGEGWVDVMEMISQKTNGHIKFILPNAPIQPVTINMGMKMPSWYDIKSLSARGDEDKSQVDESKSFIESLVKEEIEKHGIESNRIVIGGFSQGAALSLYTFYSTTTPLAGCMALSGYLPLAKQFKESIMNKDINVGKPMVMFHGEADQVVRFPWGKQSYEAIVGDQEQKFNSKFISFPFMGHQSCQEEIEEMIKFIHKVLPPK